MVSECGAWQVARNCPANRAKTQALMAFGPDGKRWILLGRFRRRRGGLDGTGGKWTVYATKSRRPEGEARGAGGKGITLNLAYPQAMSTT